MRKQNYFEWGLLAVLGSICAIMSTLVMARLIDAPNGSSVAVFIGIMAVQSFLLPYRQYRKKTVFKPDEIRA